MARATPAYEGTYLEYLSGMRPLREQIEAYRGMGGFVTKVVVYPSHDLSPGCAILIASPYFMLTLTFTKAHWIPGAIEAFIRSTEDCHYLSTLRVSEAIEITFIAGLPSNLALGAILVRGGTADAAVMIFPHCYEFIDALRQADTALATV